MSTDPSEATTDPSGSEAEIVRTVETHRAHIQQKTRQSSRPELVRYAIDHGLLE